MKGSSLKRTLVVVAAFAAVFAVALPASAHVTVTAPGATRGGSDQEITFRVPVEKNANTVKLAVALPTTTPFASVDVKPIPGWTHVEKTVKLATPIKTDDGNITEAVSQITWTAAAGQGLKPGEYGDFTFIAGMLPDTPSVVFGAIQTYSDGSVVQWTQRAAAGTAEPDFPAPTLNLAAASAASSAPTAAAATTKTVVQKSSNTAPTVLAIIALVLAAGALGVAFVGNARRKASPS
jgi:periplasmic copper chaperone A